MSPSFLTALLAGDHAEAERLIGASVPREFALEVDGLLRLRLAEMEADPDQQPWLLRAVVRRQDGAMIGHVGFHDPPRAGGEVEVGYVIFPEHQRQGYAVEAVEALFAWAEREHGITRFVASIAPANVSSLSMAAKLGFRQIGTQWDEEDGDELVFERVQSNQ